MTLDISICPRSPSRPIGADPTAGAGTMVITVAVAAAVIVDIAVPPVVVGSPTADLGNPLVVAEIIRQVALGIGKNLGTGTTDGDTSHHLLTVGDFRQMTENMCHLISQAGFFLVNIARKTTHTSNAHIYGRH